MELVMILLAVLAAILVVAGVVRLVQKDLLWGLILLIVGIVLGSYTLW